MFVENTASTTTSNVLTLAKMEEIIEIVKNLPKDPLAHWMSQQGFDPAQGGLLIWPVSLQADWGRFGPPQYVRFSQVLENPILISKVDAPVPRQYHAVSNDKQT